MSVLLCRLQENMFRLRVNAIETPGLICWSDCLTHWYVKRSDRFTLDQWFLA